MMATPTSPVITKEVEDDNNIKTTDTIVTETQERSENKCRRRGILRRKQCHDHKATNQQKQQQQQQQLQAFPVIKSKKKRHTFKQFPLLRVILAMVRSGPNRNPATHKPLLYELVERVAQKHAAKKKKNKRRLRLTDDSGDRTSERTSPRGTSTMSLDESSSRGRADSSFFYAEDINVSSPHHSDDVDDLSLVLQAFVRESEAISAEADNNTITTDSVYMTDDDDGHDAEDNKSLDSDGSPRSVVVINGASSRRKPSLTTNPVSLLGPRESDGEEENDFGFYDNHDDDDSSAFSSSEDEDEEEEQQQHGEEEFMEMISMRERLPSTSELSEHTGRARQRSQGSFHEDAGELIANLRDLLANTLRESFRTLNDEEEDAAEPPPPTSKSSLSTVLSEENLRASLVTSINESLRNLSSPDETSTTTKPKTERHVSFADEVEEEQIDIPPVDDDGVIVIAPSIAVVEQDDPNVSSYARWKSNLDHKSPNFRRRYLLESLESLEDRSSSNGGRGGSYAPLPLEKKVAQLEEEKAKLIDTVAMLQLQVTELELMNQAKSIQLQVFQSSPSTTTASEETADTH